VNFVSIGVDEAGKQKVENVLEDAEARRVFVPHSATIWK
jgi:hypothetical protein